MHTKTRRNKILGFVVILVLLGVAICAGIMYMNTQSPLVTIAKSITAFTPYYPKDINSSGFQLENHSVEYTHNVLVFQLKNDKGLLVSVTEQALPEKYAVDDLKADKELRTLYGELFITDGTMRTTGALFTNDRTWIMVNAPTPIGAAAMQALLESFVPTR